MRQGHPLRPAVFFDKDGTLVRDVPYNVDPEQIVLMPGALQAPQRLQAAGYALVIVSNQSGVAKGYFQPDALRAVEDRLRELFASVEVQLSGFYFCPHHPAGTVQEFACACECRKPQPGLLQRAAHELRLDLARSWMIGDLLNDVEAGRRAGCRSVLLDSGGETEWIAGPLREPELVTSELLLAADWILHHDHRAAQPGVHHVCQQC
jgi:histidinol-phosphate phosphatase family protein